MKELKTGSITSPLGFKANAVCSGIKKGKLDLALIYSIVKAKAAGVFTQNRIKAAHITIDQEHLRTGVAQAIIVNSGNANCGTGKKGQQDALKIVVALARQLKINTTLVLIASTGVIGKFLPLQKVLAKIPNLAAGLNFDGAAAVAKGIMTTDTFCKQLAVEIKIKNKRVIIGAVAKGAGMICPNMATLLCFITTDANIQRRALKDALGEAVESSFNLISVDGEMSTNDTVFVLANGLAGNALLTSKNKDYRLFKTALKNVCLKLAKMIVEDGEGATKIIQVDVQAAKNKNQARSVARQIANSLLVKTMIAGENPNWGRILACVGAAPGSLPEGKLEIFVQGRLVYRNSYPVLKDKRDLIKLLAKKQIWLKVNLNQGTVNHTMFASDLTTQYVRINTAYN